MKQRPNIGFFTCHLDNDYAFEVCKGIEYAAREADVNLVIFPGMYMNASYNDPVNAKYDYQYNSIYYYASHKTLDALVVSIGSIGSFLSVDDMKSFLANFDIPILTIEVEVPGYPYLYTECATGMRKAIEHLIKDCNKTKIGFVSGRKENADAIERLSTYKTVLTENNIPIDDKKIVYGDFSEFSESIVEKLLDDNKDLEAIAFANDQMAIGGYKVLKSRGYKIGKDILVTGFDNSVTSLVLDPPLTTADNNIMDLGYNALYQALSLLETGKTTTSILHSDLIIRNSTGCNPVVKPNSSKNVLNSKTPAEALKLFKQNYLKEYNKCFYTTRLFDLLDPFFMIFFNIHFDSSKNISTSELCDELDTILQDEIIYYFSTEKLTYSLRLISEYLLNIEQDPEKKLKLSVLFTASISHLAFNLSNKLYLSAKEHKATIWSSVYITRDTLLTSNNERYCFQLIMEKLMNNGFTSAYIYLYDEPVKLLPNGCWKIPDNILFQACNKEGNITVFQDSEKMLPTSMIFNNQYTVNDKRHTMVITPLFTNEIQHGLFICDANIYTFSNIYSATLQLGTSLKFISLMKQQFAIQSKLESSMNEINEKNDLLNQLYITDELTKLYNRRGFFELVQRLIHLESNNGKRAIITFADMDNLKQVNDKFGHKEGDFSLKKIAENLKSTFSTDSIIGRLGGDEFVAFKICDNCFDINSITSTISANSTAINETCGKPYYIDLSCGSKEFICSPDVNIEDIMFLADEVLYANKRYKRKSVLK